jgi:hypothetical protein
MRILLFLFLSIIGNIALAQNGALNYYNNFDNSREPIKKAGISKEFIYAYLVKSNQTTDSAVIAIITYDTAGLVLKHENFLLPVNDSKFIIDDSKSIYFYDESDRLIKIVTTYPKAPSTTQEFHYDSLGNEIFRASYSNFHQNREWKEYDKQGRLTIVSTKISNGKKYIYQKLYYEQDGFLVRTEGFEPNGSRAYTESDEYSADSLVIKSYLKNSGPKMLRSVSYYNVNRQLTRKDVYELDGGNQYTMSAYRYNPDGTIAESQTSSNGTIRDVRRHYYYLFD